jgi:hypothetical protein
MHQSNSRAHSKEFSLSARGASFAIRTASGDVQRRATRGAFFRLFPCF